MPSPARTVLFSVALGTAAALAAPAPASAGTPPIEAPAGGWVATIRTGTGVTAETFRVHLVEPADVEAAFRSLDQGTAAHPNGRVVRTGPEVNTGYDWHLDPADVSFSSFSIELCDGRPSDVGEDWWAANSPRFCPWQSVVTEMTALG